MKNRYSLKTDSVILLFLTVAISILGVIVVGSAQESLQRTQIAGLLLGLLIMIIVALIDYHWILQFHRVIYITAIALLLSVILFGARRYGAVRWIDLGFMQFQPSELCKVLLILFFAKFFATYKSRLNKPRTILTAIGLIGVPLLMIFVQPDLSTTIIVALIFSGMFYMAGLTHKVVLPILISVLLLAVAFVFLASMDDAPILSDYQQTRIKAWRFPEEYKTEEGMQQQNAIIAIGSGELSGKGLNNDDVDSMKNGNFIPELQTDFIFVVVGEELGFVGCCSVIFLLLFIVICCLTIAKRTTDEAGRMICCGIACWIGFQTIVNISVTTGLIPNTGVTLPFVSYGLTSLVSLFIGIGFVMNVSIQPQKYERQVRII